ncbi:Pentatricopeptide repeat-containing protein [Actinidia chinensis var. chinensis]|uniref:Pentatricopeptide repeat-containing protein n=1 Tax=Actinidia chinensis var. chinensis TaxID=1590841 RepID=A0A2R6QG45_ACTCC|nr:Pentatricopeptide repeat-containing protein [Actinidia chinensis var. chinensis]
MRGDVFVWGGLLSVCRIHVNVEVTEKAAEHVMEIKPEDGGVYAVLANIYANAERCDDLAKIRRLRDSTRVKKNTICSLIQLDGVLREFVAGDSLHPQTGEKLPVCDGDTMDIAADANIHYIAYIWTNANMHYIAFIWTNLENKGMEYILTLAQQQGQQGNPSSRSSTSRLTDRKSRDS